MSHGPIPIVLDSRIRIPLDRLTDEAADELREEFTHDNPDHEKERRRLKAGGFRRKGPPVPEKIRTWREEHGELTLPRGRFARVREILAEHGLAFSCIDKRTTGTGPRPVGYALAKHLIPAPFQNESADAAAKYQNCIVRAPTGSGKTLIAQMLAARLGVCTLVLVQTRELLNQWRRRLVVELGLREGEIGSIQGKRAKIRPINVVLVQTMAKHVDEHRDTFGAIIFDEVQRAAAKTFYPAVDGLRAMYRIGVSADERRKDRKDFLIYDIFGRVVADVDRKRLIEDGFILDTEIRMVPTNFRSEWYEGIEPSRRQDTDFNRLLAQMAADQERNQLIARLAIEQTRDGHLVLVFSHRVEHCLGLRADIVAHEARCGVVVGDPELRRESDETIAGLATGTIRAAVGTYQSIGTGVDLPAVDRGIAATPIHSNKPFVGQVRGRLCRVDRRPNATKKDSVLYVLWDRHIHGLVPLRNYLRFNAGNVTVMDPETGALTPGRAFLKAAERDEDAKERAQRELF